jgi:predicted transcriptional regulator
MSEAITLQIPDPLYQRLANIAQATHRPIEEVVLHSLKVGSPTTWDNVPEEFQTDLAALDRLEDEALW